MGLIVFALYL